MRLTAEEAEKAGLAARGAAEAEYGGVNGPHPVRTSVRANVHRARHHREPTAVAVAPGVNVRSQSIAPERTFGTRQFAPKTLELLREARRLRPRRAEQKHRRGHYRNMDGSHLRDNLGRFILYNNLRFPVDVELVAINLSTVVTLLLYQPEANSLSL